MFLNKFFSMFFRKDSIGMSFGDKRITIIQITNSNEIVTLNSIELGEGLVRGGRIINSQQLAYRIKDCFEKSPTGSFSKQAENLKLYATIPEQFHFVHAVNLPEKLNQDELKKFAEEKFYESVPMGELSCYITYTVEDGKLFIYGMMKDIYDSYYRFLQSLGFKEINIISKAFALEKSLFEERISAPSMIVRLGSTNSLIFIFTASKNLALSISVLSGLNDLKAVGAEIREAVKYFETNFKGKIDSIILAGEGAFVKDMNVQIEQMTGIKCLVGNIASKVKGAELINKVDSSILYATALGLALMP